MWSSLAINRLAEPIFRFQTELWIMSETCSCKIYLVWMAMRSLIQIRTTVCHIQARKHIIGDFSSTGLSQNPPSFSPFTKLMAESRAAIVSALYRHHARTSPWTQLIQMLEAMLQMMFQRGSNFSTIRMLGSALQPYQATPARHVHEARLEEPVFAKRWRHENMF